MKTKMLFVVTVYALFTLNALAEEAPGSKDHVFTALKNSKSPLLKEYTFAGKSSDIKVFELEGNRLGMLRMVTAVNGKIGGLFSKEQEEHSFYTVKFAAKNRAGKAVNLSCSVHEGPAAGWTKDFQKKVGSQEGQRIVTLEDCYEVQGNTKKDFDIKLGHAAAFAAFDDNSVREDTREPASVITRHKDVKFAPKGRAFEGTRGDAEDHSSAK